MLDPRGLIKKVSITFAAMFLLLLIRHLLLSKQANNVLTWDRAVLVEDIVAGFQID